MPAFDFFLGSIYFGAKTAAAKSVMMEVYLTPFRNRHGRDDRTADERESFAAREGSTFGRRWAVGGVN